MGKKKHTDLFFFLAADQMHRAAFVLPTFAKRELEAYGGSTRGVCFFNLLNDKSACVFSLLCVFHNLDNFLKA